MSDDPQGKPLEELQPGSWTEAEVDALVGRRVRFKNSGASGSGEGAVALDDKDGVTYQYAVV